MNAACVARSNAAIRAVISRQRDALAGDAVAVVSADDVAAVGRQRHRAIGGADGAHDQVAAGVGGVGRQRDVAIAGDRVRAQPIGFNQRDAAVRRVRLLGAEVDGRCAAREIRGADGALVADRAVGRQVDGGGVDDRAAKDRAAGVVDREGVAAGVDRAQLDVANGIADRAGAHRSQAGQAGIAFHRDERATAGGAAGQRADAGVDGVAGAGGADGVPGVQGQRRGVDLGVGIAIAQQRGVARDQRHVVIADVDGADGDVAVAADAQVQAARVRDVAQHQAGRAAAAAVGGGKADGAQAVARRRSDAVGTRVIARRVQRQRIDVRVGIDVDVAGVLDVQHRGGEVDFSSHGADAARALGGQRYLAGGDALAVVGAAQDAVVAGQAHRAGGLCIDDADVLADAARQRQVQAGVVTDFVDLQAAVVDHVEQQLVRGDVVGGGRQAGRVQRQAGQVAVVVHVDVAAARQVELAGRRVDLVGRTRTDLAGGEQRYRIARDVRGGRQVDEGAAGARGRQADAVGGARVDGADVQRAVAREREVQAGGVAHVEQLVAVVGIRDVERQALGRNLDGIVHALIRVVGGDVQAEQVRGIVQIQVVAGLRGQLAGVRLNRVATGADGLRGGQRQRGGDEVAARALQDGSVGDVDACPTEGAVVAQRQRLVIR
ncbi:hypothetical protein D3C72_1010700 [compost metagenome]